MTNRPISRVAILTASGAGQTLARDVADALAPHGVSALVDPPAGGLRVDLALWLPGDDGRVPRWVPGVVSRVHAAFVVGQDVDLGRAANYDALLTMHEVLVADVAHSVASLARAPAVIAAPLPLVSESDRQAEKHSRGLSTRPTLGILIDESLMPDAQRVFFQLALVQRGCVFIFFGGQQKRLADLADRHRLSAYVAPRQALRESAPALDILVGGPRWSELLCLAQFSTATLWLADDDEPLRPLLRALRQAGALLSVGGVLRLAAAVDAFLCDDGKRLSCGVALSANLTSSGRAFIERAESLRQGRGHKHTPWRKIGPHAGATTNAVVMARDAEAERPEDRSAAIEAALTRLKKKMASS